MLTGAPGGRKGTVDSVGFKVTVTGRGRAAVAGLCETWDTASSS